MPIVIDANALPGSYEPTPGDAAAVAAANVVVLNGDSYDDFMTLPLGAAGDRPVRVSVAELSGVVPPGGGPYNEHFWYSLPTMATLATRLANEFGKLDPAGAAGYGARAATFATKIGELTARTNAIEEKHTGERVVVTDPTPEYLVQEAGLSDVTPDQFSASEDGPSDAVLNQTLALFRTNLVRTLIVNTQAGSPQITQVEQAATASNVPIVRMTETIPAGTTDYLVWMGRQIDELGAALDRPR
jgi:zinc/manganese transport system substrate-binding protein